MFISLHYQKGLDLELLKSSILVAKNTKVGWMKSREKSNSALRLYGLDMVLKTHCGCLSFCPIKLQDQQQIRGEVCERDYGEYER